MAVSPLWASAQTEDEHLAGIDSIRAMVSLTTDNDALLQGLTQRRLQTVLELELRRNGIVVSNTSGPALYIEIIAITDSSISEVLVFHYSSQLFEYGAPYRILSDPDTPSPLLQIVTWGPRNGVAIIGSDRMPNFMEQRVVEMAQDFANAYLKANPR